MIDAAALKLSLSNWCVAIQNAAPELNSLDGKLGDGDLGATLEKCAANISESIPTLGDTLSEIFRSCAMASSKASGSSFGTLLSIAFLSASKKTIGAASLDKNTLSNLLSEIVSALSSRGGASLGDKTVLDPLDAVSKALAAADNQADLKQTALAAARQTLDTFRNQPNKIGRARMFAERSIGMDDPGMVALLRMIEAL